MNATSEAIFDPVYWRFFSPEINDMVARIKAVNVTNTAPQLIPGTRQAIAQQTAALLAAAGRTTPVDLVDEAIHVQLWGPFFTMLLRTQEGATSEPDATGKYQIPVSIDLDAYPVYGGTPVPPPPPAPVSLVGFGSGGFYTAVQPQAGEQLKDGQAYSDPSGRGTFIYHSILTPFGFETWFTLQSAAGSITAPTV